MYHDIRWTAAKIEKRLALIQPLVYRRRQPLPPFEYRPLSGPGVAPPIDDPAGEGAWETLVPGDYWGGRDTNFLLRTRFQLPDSWPIDAPTGLHLSIGVAGDFSHPEALVYIDNVPYAACDRHHQEVPLAPDHIDHAPRELLLLGWTGTRRMDDGAKLQMRECALVQFDQPTRDLVALAQVALGAVQALADHQPARAHLLNALDEAFKTLDTREPFGQRFYASVPTALDRLRAGIANAGPALDVDITAAGHAHIDVAWLWTLAETRRKAGRTFHNVLRLMDQFPAFHFTQSQPQLYEFVRQDYPELFDAIRVRVAEGRWEPIGGMWVEADCNLSGPESLVRQLVLGRRYFREQFGGEAESPVLWLPDVFGYAWSLPQLIAEAGLKYFFTIKIGWSQYNRFPYDSFWWQGLDGTRVLTHFSPTKERDSAFTSTYNANASPSQVMSTWTNFLQKDDGRPGVTPPLLMSYGYGDGGGGPTHEMMENIRELADFPGMPRVQPGKVIDFFEKLELKASNIPIGSDGLLTQPYWSAVMDPHWDASARGTVTGFTNSHTPAHMYRSIIEGITLDQVLSTRRLEDESGLDIQEYLAIGGGAHSPLWRQMLADASGKQVLISDTIEASSLGAAMIAAYGAGWFSSIEEAAAAMSSHSQLILPDHGNKDAYGELLGIYEDMYAATAEINRRLAAIASRGAGMPG